MSANSSFEQQLEDSLHSGTEAWLLPPFLLVHLSRILRARLRCIPAQIERLLGKDESSVLSSHCLSPEVCPWAKYTLLGAGRQPGPALVLCHIGAAPGWLSPGQRGQSFWGHLMNSFQKESGCSSGPSQGQPERGRLSP